MNEWFKQYRERVSGGERLEKWRGIADLSGLVTE